MAETLYLKHVYPNEVEAQKYYFYEGEVDIHYGVIELPLVPERSHWGMRAWMKGYRLDPETGREITRDELVGLYEGVPLPEPETTETQPETAESTESAGENDGEEDTSTGGQPAGEDGVREGQPARSERVSTRRLASSKRNGATK